jgi:hypothetical protein
MSTVTLRVKNTAVATAVVAAAVSGLTVLPAHADARAPQRAPRQMAVTLDHVSLKVTSPDVPAGKPYVAAPGTGVQVASVSDLKPVYQYLSVLTVPFGETLPQSVYPFPVSKAGDTAAWVRALHGTQNGPVATIFGQKIRGTVVHSHGDLTGAKGPRTEIEAIEWIVDAGGRTWVVNLQHDQAHLPKRFGTELSVVSGNTRVRTTVDPTRNTPDTAPGTSRFHANDVALGGSLGRPSWWSATCDGNGSTLSSSGAFMGLQVCTNGGNAIDNVPGVAQYEWQCADLSDRYLVQRYGLNGPGGNGNQVATNWYNDYPSKFQLHSNGDGAKTAPVPGDVVSFAVGAAASGHTGVVYKSTVDSSGNGTVYFVDQNWTGDGGYNSASVSNWNVSEITGEGGSVQWLHNPADDASTAPMTNLAGGQVGGGHTDLVALETATGTLWLYPGTGSGTLGSRVQIGTGWGGMTNLTLGDFNKSGHDGLVALEKSTGILWLYPGTGSINGENTLGTRVQIGTGWGGMSELTAINLGGTEGLLALEKSTGILWLYPGTGSINGENTLGTRIQVGTGWGAMTNLTAPGVLNKDGKSDLVAVDSSGNLWAYPYSGQINGMNTFGTRTQIGTSWNIMSYLAGGDFNSDGNGDVIAVEAPDNASGNLYLYPGTGLNTLGARTQIGTSW